MATQSRGVFIVSIVIGLTLVFAFQNCAKDSESPVASKVATNTNKCTNPFACPSPTPTPTGTVSPTPTSTPTPTVTPTPTPVNNKQAAIVSAGIMKAGVPITEGGFYGLDEVITAFVNATNATGALWGGDSLACTGTGTINCKNDYGPFGTNLAGFYGDLDAVASNGSSDALKSPPRVFGSQCFALLNACKYFSIADSVERGRPRSLGLVIASNRTPENCSAAFKDAPDVGASGTWDRSTNVCFIFRAAFDEAQASDYECFYPVKDTLAGAISEPISESNRQPCNGGKTLVQLGGDISNYTGTADGYGAIVVRKKSTGQSDRVIVHTTCTDQNCITALDQNSHRRQTCLATTSGGGCSNL